MKRYAFYLGLILGFVLLGNVATTSAQEDDSDIQDKITNWFDTQPQLFE